MSTELLTGNVWTRLKPAVSKRSRTAYIAVAYFGKGATEREERVHDDAEKTARRRRKHRRNWTVASFQWLGSHSFEQHDRVAMITREKAGKQFCDPPGTVLYVRQYRRSRGSAALSVLNTQSGAGVR
jgi:hypothetical protein